jgi:hypothetical protein
LVGKPKKPLVRPRHRWEDNIEMDLGEGEGGIEWIELAQYRVVIAVMNLRVAQNAGNL